LQSGLLDTNALGLLKAHLLGRQLDSGNTGDGLTADGVVGDNKGDTAAFGRWRGEASDSDEHPHGEPSQPPKEGHRVQGRNSQRPVDQFLSREQTRGFAGRFRNLTTDPGDCAS
jgi:hypothetical protein